VLADRAEELRARFVELAPDGFEEAEAPGGIELAAYGPAADRVCATFPEASVTAVEDGWEDRWREFHRSVTIGSLWVGPPWEEPPVGVTAVVIDPGRAFGTGAHPSTRLALELLLDEEPRGVLDIGCGSGVIAIAAAKLGFAPVAAVDVDETAVEVTRANAADNGVEIEARTADARRGQLPTVGLAVANISLELVEVAAPALESERLITAGYLAADRPDLSGFTHLRRAERDGWAADAFSRAR
jgi:ribosomal protein L11 methyltransferase